MYCSGDGSLPGPDRTSGAGQTRRLALSGSEGPVRRSREFSRQALERWHWLPAVDDHQRAVAEDVLLMVSELVTNACLHAPGGPRELRLNWNGTRLRVEVSDSRTPLGNSQTGLGDQAARSSAARCEIRVLPSGV
ncbi:ATP-binding protein, partial [Kitasatospora sp. NPDC101155]|uniref:ATP-binding protein n=1 Tax=Kitasatospora sp. NPDC101155 TaxID=3364097 RepID=UPI00382644E9